MNFEKILCKEHFKTKENKINKSQKASKLSIKHWQEGHKITDTCIIMNTSKQLGPLYKNYLKRYFSEIIDS